MNMPLVLLNRRRRGFTAFSPSTLFSTTAIGIWLDPSDLSTMFSDRAGTTPVTTPGTVVGLRLDKSKGLVQGAELVANGDFSGGATGWTQVGGVTFSTNGASVPANAYFYRAISVTTGQSYLITFDVSNYSGTGSILVDLDTQSPYGSVVGGNGPKSIIISATGGFIFLRAATTNSFTIDNISVRELAGNHAVAPTDAARPTYGVEPKGGRRNLLTWSEGFASAPWVKANITITANAAVAPDGTMTATKFTSFAGFGNQGVYNQSAVFTWNGQSGSFYVKAGTTSIVSVCSVVNQVRAYYDIGNVTVGNTLNCTASITSVGNGWYRCECVSSSTGSGGYYAIVIEEALRTVNPWDNYTGTGKDLFIWGAQLELGSTATAYQRVTTAYDITESGVATCHYVQYDGSDDSMSTAAIDFTATDKMSVFAGVRKLSDAASGMLAEFGNFATPTNGSWRVSAPITGGAADYSFASRFSSSAVATYTSASVAAPNSSVLSGLADISGDLATLRINGVQRAQSTDDQGTGNYGNHSLFIGRRNNATLPFNGKDYGIIVVGKAASAGEITDTETWLAAKTAQVTL